MTTTTGAGKSAASSLGLGFGPKNWGNFEDFLGLLFARVSGLESMLRFCNFLP
uniref:Uncharacterized protein n=1 Tax=Arundo donax TaxID=35708 RepID=A0A0A9DT18_ARUDO